MKTDKHKIWVGLSAVLMTSSALAGGALAAATGDRSGDAYHHAGGDAVPGFRLAAERKGEGGEGGERGEHHMRGEGGERGEHHMRGEAGEGGEGGEGGERGEHHMRGEGGEGGEAGEGGQASDAAKLAESEAEYLTRLGLMRGHLTVGVALYRAGEKKAALTHMKHPEDELYEGIVPVLNRRGVSGFERELEALADRVKDGAPTSQVEKAFSAVSTAIEKAENAVAKLSPGVIGDIIYELVQTSAKEYAEAVADGAVVEGHEYQDSLGFVQVAEVWLARLRKTGADTDSVDQISQQLALIKPAWPSPIPPKRAVVDPTVIYGAAARIEIAVLGLKS